MGAWKKRKEKAQINPREASHDRGWTRHQHGGKVSGRDLVNGSVLCVKFEKRGQIGSTQNIEVLHPSTEVPQESIEVLHLDRTTRP